MRFGYDLRNPREREMYIDKKQREFNRVFDKEKTANEKVIEGMKENQREMEYFIQREKQLQEMEKEVQEQIETEIPLLVENVLGDLLKGF